MKTSFIKALKVFKYLAILFSIVYWIYIVIDDYSFIQNYWETNLLEYIIIWGLYFVVYFIVFSVYYWAITTIIILIYHTLIKLVKIKKS